MGEKDGHQSLGIDLLRPNDSTLWKRALKSKPGRPANDRKLIFVSRPRRGLLATLLDCLKRPRQ